MEQMSMFPPVVEAFSLTAVRDVHGWTMRIAARLEGQRWTDTPWHTYERMSMAELLEVVDGTASQIGSEIV